MTDNFNTSKSTETTMARFPLNPTVSEWFNSKDCNFKHRGVCEITEKARKSIYETFIQEEIGDIKINNVKSFQLKEILKESKDKGFANGTIFSIYAVLTLIFRSAYREHLIDLYPCEGLVELTRE